MSSPVIPAPYRVLMASSRLSTGTRRALEPRAIADDPGYRPEVFTSTQWNTLRAVVARVLPQPDAARIDLAARLDAQLASGRGEGWRFARLPDDRTAYACALSVLNAEAQDSHGKAFADLADPLQDGILARAQAGELHTSSVGMLDGAQMRLWFEDVCADAVKLYVAHPATLARIGYGGIFYGGDGADKPGFSAVGLGEREPWEPMPEADGDKR